MHTIDTPLSVVSFLKPYLLKYKAIIFVFLLTIGFAAVETGLEAFSFKLLIDTVNKASSEELLQAILWPALFYIGMSLYHNLVMRTYAWAAIKLYPALKKQLTEDLFSHSTKHSVSFFQNNLAGDVASKIHDVVESVEPLLKIVFEIFIARILQPFIVAIFLSMVSWTLSLIFIVWTVLFVTCTLQLSKRINKASYTYFQEKNLLSGKIVDVLGNIITTKIFGRIQFEHQGLTKALTKIKNDEIKMQTELFILHFIQGLLSTIIIAIFIGLLIYYRTNLQVTAGDFVFVITLLISNLVHIYALGEGIGASAKMIAKFRQAINLLMRPHDVKDTLKAIPLKVLQGSITFKNIEFQYVEDKPIFSHLNLHIQPGEKVGIVGPSGAGKSTLINLLLRLFEAEKGTIHIDEQNIADVTLKSLRDQITLVPQNIDLFHRSVFDNIRYGYLEASDDLVKQAAKLAECDEFILQLPEGYQTLVGERGLKLSGGQKQRIAIARAYLKPAKILILDEATASLDAVTEAYIQRALTQIMQGKTTLIIAHRLATLKQMDRIIVLDKGKIVQDGTLSALIKQPGLFSTLWKQQYFTDSE